MNDRPVVVALGGNAISRKGEEGNVDQQFARTRESCTFIVDLVASGWRVVVTHGNGPQVGNILRRVELSESEVYPIPLHLCVADTQAGMGFMITQCLNNEFAKRGIDRTAYTMITNVEVDPADPAFSKPTKPIGKYLDAETAHRLGEQHGWLMKEFDKKEFRRVVASPSPKRIVEMPLIRRLVNEGELLVACGGGGIPVVRNAAGDLIGTDCVLDKDRTTALLAAELNASFLVIATSVEKVMLDYRTSNERALDALTVAEARGYMASGQFPAGTMGPKIEAAVEFLEKTSAPDPAVLITKLDCISDALAGHTGTRITRA